MTHRLPPKKDVARALLLRGNVFVHLDPRQDGVCVPEWLKDRPQLVLQVGLDLPLPIPDLRVDETGVYGTLSFHRSPFRCEVHWGAVFALVGDDGRGMVWPDALPQEIASEVDRGFEAPPFELPSVPNPPPKEGTPRIGPSWDLRDDPGAAPAMAPVAIRSQEKGGPKASAATLEASASPLPKGGEVASGRVCS